MDFLVIASWILLVLVHSHCDSLLFSEYPSVPKNLSFKEKNDGGMLVEWESHRRNGSLPVVYVYRWWCSTVQNVHYSVVSIVVLVIGRFVVSTCAWINLNDLCLATWFFFLKNNLFLILSVCNWICAMYFW